MNLSNLYIEGVDDSKFKKDYQKYLRYYLTNNGQTLELHVNIKYFIGNCEYSRRNQNGDFIYKNYNWMDFTLNGDGEHEYIDMFAKGLNRAYNIFVPGSNYDFDNHSFYLKIKIHEYDKLDYEDQLYPIERPCTYLAYMGSNNTYIDDYNSYWFYAVVNDDYRRLCLPTSNQIEGNFYDSDRILLDPEGYTVSYFMYTSAHEFAHLLGLNDAYDDNDNTDRMNENYETCYIKQIFDEGELDKEAVVRNFRTTASDGKNYNVASDIPASL